MLVSIVQMSCASAGLSVFHVLTRSVLTATCGGRYSVSILQESNLRHQEFPTSAQLRC